MSTGNRQPKPAGAEIPRLPQGQMPEYGVFVQVLERPLGDMARRGVHRNPGVKSLLDRGRLVLLRAQERLSMIRPDFTPIPRRTFFAYGLAAGWAASRAFAESPASKIGPGSSAASAWSRLKKKLADGHSATLLIISDSTGYRDDSGTRRFIRWLASQYPSHRLTELCWAGWV